MDTPESETRTKRSVKKTLLFLLPYLLFCGSLAYTLYVNQSQTKDRLDSQAQASIDSDYHVCLEANNVRQVIRDLVVSGGSGFDFSTFPSFANLDQATKTFLNDVAAASAASNTPEAKVETLKKVPLRDCEAAYPTHN